MRALPVLKRVTNDIGEANRATLAAMAQLQTCMRRETELLSSVRAEAAARTASAARGADSDPIPSTGRPASPPCLAALLASLLAWLASLLASLRAVRTPRCPVASLVRLRPTAPRRLPRRHPTSAPRRRAPLDHCRL